MCKSQRALGAVVGIVLVQVNGLVRQFVRSGSEFDVAVLAGVFVAFRVDVAVYFERRFRNEPLAADVARERFGFVFALVTPGLMEDSALDAKLLLPFLNLSLCSLLLGKTGL